MLDAEFYQLSYGVSQSFPMENLKIFLRARFIIYRKCPFKGQLSLVGYAQYSVPGELNVRQVLKQTRSCVVTPNSVTTLE